MPAEAAAGCSNARASTALAGFRLRAWILQACRAAGARSRNLPAAGRRACMQTVLGAAAIVYATRLRERREVAVRDWGCMAACSPRFGCFIGCRGRLWGTRGSQFCPCRFDGEAPHDFSHASESPRSTSNLPSVTCSGLAACKTLACRQKAADRQSRGRRRSTVLSEHSACGQS